MPWFNLSFSDFIKKKITRFLANRYLGQFFEEKLSADQICIDLYNGKGCVYNVALCCEVKAIEIVIKVTKLNENHRLVSCKMKKKTNKSQFKNDVNLDLFPKIFSK
jgi:hypothetical protein